MLSMSNELNLLLAERGMRRIDLAKALGVNKSLVTRWFKGRIPVERLEAVEKATGISRNKLRPDLAGMFSPSEKETGGGVSPPTG